jgi:hypothetical protein
LLTNASLEIKGEVKESGKYLLTTNYIPGVTVSLMGADKFPFIVMPDKETNKILFELCSHDPKKKQLIGAHLQQILGLVARDMARSQEHINYEYFPQLRMFVLAATLPEKVASMLHQPEQILEFTKNSYQNIIKPLLEVDESVKEFQDWFIFRTLRYDPVTRNLSQLPREAIKEKARKVLERLSN